MRESEPSWLMTSTRLPLVSAFARRGPRLACGARHDVGSVPFGVVDVSLAHLWEAERGLHALSLASTVAWLPTRSIRAATRLRCSRVDPNTRSTLATGRSRSLTAADEFGTRNLSTCSPAPLGPNLHRWSREPTRSPLSRPSARSSKICVGLTLAGASPAARSVIWILRLTAVRRVGPRPLAGDVPRGGRPNSYPGGRLASIWVGLFSDGRAESGLPL